MLRPVVLTLLFLFPALLFSVLPAEADSIPPSYDINGTLSITGNGDACGGAPCVETLTYSFVLNYSLVPADQGQAGCLTCLGPDIYLGQTAGPILVASSGPLGFFGSSGGLLYDHGYYLPFFDTPIDSKSNGDEIDLFMGGIETDPALGAPLPYPLNPSLSALYSCRSTDCANDFNNGVANYGYVDVPASFAQFTATRVTVPEPSTLSLLALGILALLAAMHLMGERLRKPLSSSFRSDKLRSFARLITLMW